MKPEEPRKIYNQNAVHYGSIQVKLGQMMQQRGISVYRMNEVTKADYNTIRRYRDGQNIQMVDIDLFAKICYAFHCDLTDLLEYIPPQDESKG